VIVTADEATEGVVEVVEQEGAGGAEAEARRPSPLLTMAAGPDRIQRLTFPHPRLSASFHQFRCTL